MAAKNHPPSRFDKFLQTPPSLQKAPDLWPLLRPRIVPFRYFGQKWAAAAIILCLCWGFWQQWQIQKLSGRLQRVETDNMLLQEERGEPEQILQRSYSHLQRGNWQRARELFHCLRQRNTSPQIQAQVCYQLAYIAHHHEQDLDTSLRELQNFVKRNRDPQYIYPILQLGRQISSKVPLTGARANELWTILQKLENLQQTIPISFSEYE